MSGPKIWSIRLTLSVIVTVCLVAQETDKCKIDIVSPLTGDSVGISGDIRGTATVPPGMFLWIFSQREGLAKWWPQSGGTAKVRGGQWVVHATYGDERDPSKDSGANFIVTAVIVDDKTNADIANYVKKSETDNYYPGISLPPGTPGCSSKDTVVKRR